MNTIDKKLHKCLNRILEADIDEKTIEHFLTVVNKIGKHKIIFVTNKMF